MAGKDGLDLTEGLVRWPRDLHAKHHQQIMAREAEALRQRKAKKKKTGGAGVTVRRPLGDAGPVGL